MKLPQVIPPNIAGLTIPLLAALPALANPQYQQQPTLSNLFSDNFAAGFSNWTVSSNTVGRTMFGQTPAIITNGNGSVATYAQFKLDTYNAASGQAGVSFSGTQLKTNQTFGLPTTNGSTNGQGVQFQLEARVESTGLLGPAGQSGDTSEPVSEGLNASPFTYVYNSAQNYHDEIDFENLTSQQAPPTQADPAGATGHSNTHFATSNGDATLDTTYQGTANSSADNSYYSQTPYAPGDTGSVATPIDIYQWHTFDIDWFPTQVDWYVDGQLVREEAAGETSTANPKIYIPIQAMGFYINFWAPASTFGDAYFAGLAPSATAAGNQEFYYDVADASVNTLEALPTPEPTVGLFLFSVCGMTLVPRRRRRAMVYASTAYPPVPLKLNRSRPTSKNHHRAHRDTEHTEKFPCILVLPL
jgi:hypothetical protein